MRNTYSGLSGFVKLMFEAFYYLACFAIFLIKVAFWIIKQIVKLISLIFKAISYRKSKYREKSGNSLLQVTFNGESEGEYKLYKELTKYFDQESILTNVYLPSKNTTHTEVDLLAVSNGIVYCMEVKHYSGSIFGSEEDEHWTQVLSFKYKKQFYNPIRQNFAHTKALQNYLGISPSKIKPIVVFTGSANINNVNTESNVIKLSQLRTQVEEKNPFTDEDRNIIKKLSECCNVDEGVKKQHIKEVKELQEN